MFYLKQFSEWYFGVPPADPGEGTAWNFNWKSPWPSWMPTWMIFLVAVFLVGYVVWIYRRDTKSLPLNACLCLTMLRLSAISLLFFFLTELSLSVDRTGLPFVAVLIDNSASMGLEDQYSEKELPKQIHAGLAAGSHSGISRLNLVKKLLTGDQGRILKQLQKRHKFRLYHFSKSAIPIGRNAYVKEDEIDELLSMVGQLQADGEQTRPGPAIRKVLNDFRGTPPSAIIILTDGITSTTDADKLTAIADLARTKLVPIYPVGIGSEEPSRDLQLYDLLVDEVAFVDDPISFSAKLKGYAFEGTTATILLKQKEIQGDAKPTVVASKPLKVGVDGKPEKIEITYTPPREGEYEFTLEVSPLPKETNKQNNSEMRAVSVRQEKIRVLLVDSFPRYEYRYVKHLLERERTIELKTVLQDSDLEYAEEDKTALKHFPVKREELFDYDVVIFGDVNTKFLSSSIFDNLRDFVGEAGGGLVFIAGQHHNPLDYHNTPLEAMLPIELTGAEQPDNDIPLRESFQPALTLEGQKGSTIFRFAETEQENLEIWNKLPGFYWMMSTPEIKPGAIVFAEHPTRRATNGKLPVIVMHRFGGGKVLFHATDELWRWRFRVGDLYYSRYWVQAMRYLSRSRLLGRTRIAELTSDRLVYQRGENVYLRVRFLDERLVPSVDTGVTVMVERRDDVGRTVKLSRLPEAPTVFEGQLSQAGEGSYHAWIASPAFKEAPPSIDFRVESPLLELQKRSLDRMEMTQTAKITHGKFYTPNTFDRLPQEIPPGHPVPLDSEDPIPLWNRWEAMLLFAGLLLTEWLLRKRYRLI